MICKKTQRVSPIARAVSAVFESLESRQLMSGDPSIVQTLPFNLSFGAAVARTVADGTGQGTGFTSTQPNKNNTDYQPSLISLSPTTNTLSLTTTGTSTAGGSWQADNTLVDALQTGFNATTGSFTITTRLVGLLSNLTNPSEQGGVYFGQDDDNYVKLVAESTPSGQELQLVDEQHPAGSGTYTHAISTANSYTSIGSFSSITTLDLQLQANPSSGAVTGAYSINGGAFVQLSQSVTLSGAEESAFFSTDAQAGIMAMAKNNLAPITVGFSSFSIAEDAVVTPPPAGQPPLVNLSFGAAVAGTVADGTGQGTGFTSTQPNKNGTEYQPSLISLSPATNTLSLTTTGTSAAGGSWESDNTLVNALQSGFDATTGSFTITTRLVGPLSNLANPSEQGGVYFGPDDDNYVKLVAESTPSGQELQLVDEQHPAGGGTYTRAISTANSYTSIGSFSSITTLDLQIQANPSSGAVTGAYSINGGAFVQLSQSVTLSGAEESAFFSTDAQTGIMAMAKNNLAPVTVNFGSFVIAADTVVPPTPPAPPAPPSSSATPAAPPAGSIKLTGALIGTAGSYNNDGNTIGKVFDGSIDTFFDASGGNGDSVGLNLGSPATITQIQYVPRAGWESRMVGGIFQGSNTADFSSGVVNLFTIAKTPAAGIYTVQPINVTGSFTYVRYLAPAGSYGNVAEIEFDGTQTTTAPPSTYTSATPATAPVGSSKLTGSITGTAGSYENDGTTIANAFDGNLGTFYDGATTNNDSVGLALATPSQITQIQFAPRLYFPSRMVGGIFQGSNTADFSSGVVNLYTITQAPQDAVYTVVPLPTSVSFQYVRYLAPASSNGDIAELEFDGIPGAIPISTNPTPAAPPAGSNKLDGTLIGTPGSYSNSGNTIAKAVDDNLNTYFDAPIANGAWVGYDLGAPMQITQVQYSPRSDYASRMVGGIFQGSNTADFSSGVVNLLTISASPKPGAYTVAPINNTTGFQYVRYLSAQPGSYGDVAEVEFDGTTVAAPPTIVQPSVTSSSPANGATGVDRNAFVSCALDLPNGGINQGSLNSKNVYLYRTSDHTLIPTVVNTDAAGGVIVLQPSTPLDANTNYTFVVSAGLDDVIGQPFVPYTISFTTNSAAISTNPSIAFSQTALPTATGQEFTGVTLGPDGDLYATTLSGDIFQFPVNADGTLGTPNDIKTVITANGGSRIITGIAFDPSSTATNMTIWVSSSAGEIADAPDFSGKISTLSGPNFSVYQDYVVGLPRSNSNHTNNQPVFGPDGALYWGQGSNSSMGEADAVWGNRPEHLLNAAILRLDITAAEQRVVAGQDPINAQTDSLPTGQTPYDPYAAGAPLTIYASGVRNAYDLVFDTNGHLYAPTNGAAAGGNIPGTPAGVTPAAPEEINVPVAENDYLYNIVPGGYYGHPDPARGQYIFGGGNPVNPASNVEVESAYPLGTPADPNYQGYAFDIGAHYSPDGAIEYQGSEFGGALNGALLITRYSGGKDIQVLTTDSSGAVTGSETGITGFTGFTDPVDLIENNANGDIYVADLGAGKLVLLKPIASGGVITSTASTMYFNDPTGGSAGPAQTVTITNNGNAPLAIPSSGINVIGADGNLFMVSNTPSLPDVIAPGASFSFLVAYNAGSSSLGQHTAELQIQSNDATDPLLTIDLRAISTSGTGGNNEPSLQAILNLFQIPDNVGEPNPGQTAFPVNPTTPNDEVVMQQLEKVDPESPVTITPLAVFSGSTNPAAGFGYYTAGTPDSRVPMFNFSSADAQTVDPTAIGTTTFDPGTGAFGIYTSFDEFPNTATGTARFAYSENLFNTYDSTDQTKVRFYPLKNADGTVVPNAYVFATEDYGVSPYYDSNDVVGIIRNVMAVPGGPVIGTQNVSGTSDIDGAPSPTQFAFNSIYDTTSVSPPNVVHNTNTLRIDNSGSQPLIITSITSSNSAFSISTPISYPLTIAPDSSLNLTLLYAPTHTGTNAEDKRTLTITSNDPLNPNLSLTMAGFWQERGNNLLDGTNGAPGTITEPSVAQLINDVFGYTTVITNPGQNIDGNGVISAVGQEVLSPYWTRADVNLPLTVRQLALFHTEGSPSTLYWYQQGSPSSPQKILYAEGDNGQSILPVSNDSTKTPSFGEVNPNGIFGFVVDKTEFSDNVLNKVHGLDQGHHVRFWPVYDASGKLVPNEWIMAQDYQGVNFDYNDNVYLVSNMRPAPPAAPSNIATAPSSGGGVAVTWSAVNDAILNGYTVYRSTSLNSTYVALNSSPDTTTSYVDATAVPATTYYYTVAATDSWGGMSSVPKGVAGTATTAGSGMVADAVTPTVFSSVAIVA